MPDRLTDASMQAAWRKLHDYPLTGSVPAERDAIAMFEAGAALSREDEGLRIEIVRGDELRVGDKIIIDRFGTVDTIKAIEPVRYDTNGSRRVEVEPVGSQRAGRTTWLLPSTPSMRVLAASPVASREVEGMVPKARLEAVERELREVVERNTGGPRYDGP